MKLLTATVAVLVSSGFATAAQAAVIVNPNGTVTVNSAGGVNTGVVNFDGFGGDPAVVIPGLSSALTLTLTSIVGNTFNFSYSLANTSSLTGARVSSLGFDVATNVASPVGGSVTGVFDTFDQSGVNYPVGFGDVEVCIYDGPGGTCTGNGGGVDKGTSGGGTLALTFASPQTSITLSRLVDRYQGFDANGVQSAIGRPTTPLPEPATWAMFIFGFTAVGYSLRRRRSYQLAQAV